MTTALTVQQTQAIDLRSYLQSDTVKGTLSEALPKWLSADRLLRIVFSSAMRNPALLECTRESILQSVMMCAQLGLEPILGRAYLIPYKNSKKIDGQWKKVSECQMQIGYQGLIDLARRTDNIADVWGANVYENDIFELDFGMNRGLVHRPWFMEPEKRKNGQGGEIIGAYIVWQLKDGTKHPDFMPISEINKRRDRSQAFQWAETGDPKRGGGKKDSVWHQWPEEMNLKTVIKHSAKMVPSSIEFMSAVQIDNDVEIGRGVSTALDFEIPQQIEAVSDADLITKFDDRISAMEIDLEKLADFLAAIGQNNGDLTIDQVKAETMRDNQFDDLMAEFELQNPVLEETSGDSGPQTTADVYDPLSEQVQQRYSAKKASVIRKMLTDMDIDPSKMNNAEAHQKLLDMKNRDDDETESPEETNDEDIEIRAKFNELWVSSSKAAKDYAGEELSLERTVNGYKQPSQEQIPAWIEKVKEFQDNMEKEPA